ncbi:MAG: PilZ domain-containing protein [Bacteriovoracaceae bacterium]|nr:PilZ domain-containing protein [Bacteriovoracaceae bacterium]
MAASLGLVKNTAPQIEKRLLPRHSFEYLLFKLAHPAATLAVIDISPQGMQLRNRADLVWEVGQKVQGNLAWDGRLLPITGEISWANEQSCGVKFDLGGECAQQFAAYFAPAAVAPHLRLVQLNEENQVANLKCWLHAGKAAEILVWQHPTGQVAKIQVIYLGELVEWDDGLGIRTGKITSVRPSDTPLQPQETLAVEIDAAAQTSKLQKAAHLVQHLPANLLASELQDFISLKLR